MCFYIPINIHDFVQVCEFIDRLGVYLKLKFLLLLAIFGSIYTTASDYTT